MTSKDKVRAMLNGFPKEAGIKGVGKEIDKLSPLARKLVNKFLGVAGEAGSSAKKLQAVRPPAAVSPPPIPVKARDPRTAYDRVADKLHAKIKGGRLDPEKALADTNMKRLGVKAGIGTAAAVAGPIGYDQLINNDPKGIAAPTTSEQAAFKAKALKAKALKAKAPEVQKPVKGVQASDIPDEAIAGTGGAILGGAAGYAAAPSLGISRTTGAVGGATLSAIAAALVANKMKHG